MRWSKPLEICRTLTSQCGSENPVGFQCLLALETRRAACERAPDCNEAVLSAADLLPDDVDYDPRDTSFLARWAEM